MRSWDALPKHLFKLNRTVIREGDLANWVLWVLIVISFISGSAAADSPAFEQAGTAGG